MLMENSISSRLTREFFSRDVLEVAPEMPGKIMLIKEPRGKLRRYMITEVEAYRGVEDLACHASRGRTSRTEIMYSEGGHLYIYLIYGVYWMLNIVTGAPGNPQAILIRGLDGISGPGRITRDLGIDRSWYGIDIVKSEIIYLENNNTYIEVNRAPRIGIDYSGEPWKSKPWRYFASKT